MNMLIVAVAVGVVVAASLVRSTLSPIGAFRFDTLWTLVHFLLLPVLLAIESYLLFAVMLVLFLIRAFLLYVDYSVVFNKKDE